MSMGMIERAEAAPAKPRNARTANAYRTMPAGQVPVGAWHRSGRTYRILDTHTEDGIVWWETVEGWHRVGSVDTRVLVEVEVDESTL